MNEQESTKLRYEFDISDTKSFLGNGDSSVLIPIGPTVKTTLRPEVQERWQSYIATHWDDWHNYPYWAYLKGKGKGRWSRRISQTFEEHKRQGKARLSRSARASLFKGRKLVVVQGYVKAASFVAVAARCSGRLHVEFEVPPLNWFLHDQWSIRTNLQTSVWQSDETHPECDRHSAEASHRRDRERSRRFVWKSSFGFRTVPATSPGYVTFGANRYGRADMTTCYGDSLVVRTMSSQLNEHGRGLEVTDTLFYHTITMSPALPLLGNLCMWLQELPNPSQVSLYERAMKLCKRRIQLLRGADGGRENDDARGETDWLMQDVY